MEKEKKVTAVSPWPKFNPVEHSINLNLCIPFTFQPSSLLLYNIIFYEFTAAYIKQRLWFQFNSFTCPVHKGMSKNMKGEKQWTFERFSWEGNLIQYKTSPQRSNCITFSASCALQKYPLRSWKATASISHLTSPTKVYILHYLFSFFSSAIGSALEIQKERKEYIC